MTLVNRHGVAAHDCEGVRKVLYIQCKGFVKRLEMVAVSVKKKKVLRVKKENSKNDSTEGTMTDKGRWNLSCFVYKLYEINSKTQYFFSADLSYQESHLTFK